MSPQRGGDVRGLLRLRLQPRDSARVSVLAQERGKSRLFSCVRIDVTRVFVMNRRRDEPLCVFGVGELGARDAQLDAELVDLARARRSVRDVPSFGEPKIAPQTSYRAFLFVFVAFAVVVVFTRRRREVDEQTLAFALERSHARLQRGDFAAARKFERDAPPSRSRREILAVLVS